MSAPGTHTLLTADGWTLEVLRYPPAGPVAARGPVLFVHGMGANRHNFDLSPRHSLARAASQAGHDCFLVELRGRGRSRPPPGARADYCFDDFLEHDVPAALELIRQETGRAAHWVGHSMGGMLGLACAERHGEAMLRSLTLFGTPLRFAASQWGLQAWSRLVGLQRILPAVDQRQLGRRMVPLLLRLPGPLRPFLRFLANPDNVDAETAEAIFERLVANEAPGLILQFADWVRAGEFRSVDRRFSYTRHLARVRLPALMFCGQQDLMAPCAQSAVPLARLGGADVHHVLLSRLNGFSADYGHGDLIVGRRAPEEVYPIVLAWLAEVEAGASARPRLPLPRPLPTPG